MSANPFGKAVRLRDDTQSPPTTPAQDMALVRSMLAEVQPDGVGMLRLYRPLPTAAISARDVVNRNYAAAIESLRRHGFEPQERGTGGLLAAYDQSALLVDLVASHPEPRLDIHARFQIFSETLTTAFRTLGIAAQIGEVVGEYCPGAYSINVEGKHKIVGLAQRVRRNSYHLGAVISVERSLAAQLAVRDAYRLMNVPFTDETFGALTDELPNLTFAHVAGLTSNALMAQLSQP